MVEQSRMDFLVGRWTDSKGSSYDVELDFDGLTCSVTTTRPNGEVRYTKALIQDYNGCIYWGRNYELQGWSDYAKEICWVSARRGKFVWRRFLIIHVRKHDTQGCAVVTMASNIDLDSLVSQAKTIQLGETCAELKRHLDKATGALAPNKLFIAWGHQAEKRTPVTVDKLVSALEEFMQSAATRSDADHNTHACTATMNVRCAPADVQRLESDGHLHGKATASSNCSSPSAGAMFTPSVPPPACKPDVTYSDHHTAEAEIAIGDYVHGFFYGEWHPATIRRMNVDSSGSIEVQWISEWSVSVLPKEGVVRMRRREENVEQANVECKEEIPRTRVVRDGDCVFGVCV